MTEETSKKESSRRNERILGQVCRVLLCMFVLSLLVYAFVLNFIVAPVKNDITHRDRRTLGNGKRNHRQQTVEHIGHTAIEKTNPPQKERIKLEAKSSGGAVYLLINGIKVYEHNLPDGRGIHLIVINQYNGIVMGTKVFDTLVPGFEIYMAEYLSTTRNGMILVFLVKDEATMSLKETGRGAIRSLGSVSIDGLGWRDMWAFVSKDKISISEIIHKSPNPYSHGEPIKLITEVTLESKENSCTWRGSVDDMRRHEFCFKYIGYASLCDCSNPSPINFKAPNLLGNRLSSVPISVIASNRPHYLHRMLSKLLVTPGVQREMVTVYIDGFHDEVAALADLLQVKYVEHASACDGACRIHQSYRYTLHNTFKKYPDAKYMIILEEDLEVSPDIMDYYNQLLPVLASDQSVYCISAWNDNSYKHSSNDPAMVYRVETMPGLGWVLKRELFIEELESKWPSINYGGDWDLWMRLPSVRKGRECLVPDISRTFHFGKIGMHINSYVSSSYNASLITVLNKKTGNKFDTNGLKKDEYERNINNLIRNAEPLDHTKNPCNDTNFVPNTSGHTYVLYIKWAYKGDAETWLNIAQCFGLWDTDVRGFHKIMWRFWSKGNHVIVVGSRSPYFVHKPSDITPLYISNRMMGRERVFKMSSLQGFDV